MHEMPIVLNVVGSMDKFAEKHKLPEIKTVVMQIGEVASVMPDYFSACWGPAIERSKYLKASTLEIEIIPGIAKCKDCDTEFNLEKNNAICPNCNDRNWILISGREINIKEVLA